MSTRWIGSFEEFFRVKKKESAAWKLIRHKENKEENKKSYQSSLKASTLLLFAQCSFKLIWNSQIVILSHLGICTMWKGPYLQNISINTNFHLQSIWKHSLFQLGLFIWQVRVNYGSITCEFSRVCVVLEVQRQELAVEFSFGRKNSVQRIFPKV